MTAPKKRFLEFYSVTYSKQPQQQSRLDKNSLKPPKNSLKENPPFIIIEEKPWRKSAAATHSRSIQKSSTKTARNTIESKTLQQNFFLLFSSSSFLLFLFSPCSFLVLVLLLTRWTSSEQLLSIWELHTFDLVHEDDVELHLHGFMKTFEGWCCWAALNLKHCNQLHYCNPCLHFGTQELAVQH